MLKEILKVQNKRPQLWKLQKKSHCKGKYAVKVVDQPHIKLVKVVNSSIPTIST